MFMAQKDVWLESQEIRKELKRWKIRKLENMDSYAAKILYESPLLHSIVRPFLVNLIKRLKALRAELKPRDRTNCLDHLGNKIRTKVNRCLRRLGNDAYHYNNRTNLSIRSIDVPKGICVTSAFTVYCDSQWRKFDDHDLISFGRKMVTKIFKKIPHDKYEIYVVEMAEANGRHVRTKTGYLAILNSVGKLSETKQGATAALTRTIKQDVLEALT